MKKISVLLILTFCIVPILVHSETLHLSDCVELALKNNRELQRARAEVEKMNQEYNNVRGSLLPQITLSAGYQLSQSHLPNSAVGDITPLSDMIYGSSDLYGNPTANDSLEIENDQIIAGYFDGVVDEILPTKLQKEASAVVKIKLDQVIFLGGKLINGIRIAVKVKTMQQKNYFLVQQDVIYNTKDMFYQVLLLEQVVDIQHEALDLAQQYKKQVNDMFDQGLVSEYDLLRAQLQIVQLKQEILEAENNYVLLLQSFRNHLGIEENDVEFSGEFESPEISELSLSHAIAVGKRDRIELDLASINVEISEVALTIQKGSFLPSIALSSEYQKYAGTSGGYKLNYDDVGDSYQVGIGLSLPLFTGLSNSAKTAKARQSLKQAKLSYLEIEDAIELDVENSYRTLNNAKQKMESQQSNVQLAEKGLTIARARYENQIAVQLEVLDAQVQLKSARLNHLYAMYEVIMASEQLKKTIGIQL